MFSSCHLPIAFFMGVGRGERHGGVGQALEKSCSRTGMCSCGWLGSSLLSILSPWCQSSLFSSQSALSHLLPLPFLLQPNGPGGGPNTLCAVSVLLSQYFLVCSHPVSVWSALLPTSQNKTSLQSGWHNEPLSGLPFLHTAVLTVADHNRVQGGRRGVIFY